ncbi:MAG: HAD family phosphatase [Planctomycetota bacterium]|nr:MAG: HAD family phosphatase [Planctomycetota bacterium]
MSQSLCAAIFDLDGTLVDSYDAHYEAWRLISARHGVEVTIDEYYSHFGRRNEDLLRECWLRAGRGELTLDEIKELDHEKEAQYRALVTHRFPAMEGAREIVYALRAAGFRTAVGSSGPPENVARAIEGLELEGAFDAIVTGRDVVRCKPDPECFLLAAARVGVEPARCVVFEDAPAGIIAAKSAGMHCVAITSKGHTPHLQRDADLILPNVRAITVAAITQLLS